MGRPAHLFNRGPVVISNSAELEPMFIVRLSFEQRFAFCFCTLLRLVRFRAQSNPIFMLTINTSTPCLGIPSHILIPFLASLPGKTRSGLFDNKRICHPVRVEVLDASIRNKSLRYGAQHLSRQQAFPTPFKRFLYRQAQLSIRQATHYFIRAHAILHGIRRAARTA